MIGKDILRQRPVSRQSQGSGLGRTHTLARKLDRVQRKTVTNNRQMPRVLLAMPPRPYLASSPLRSGDIDRVRIDEPIEAARFAASSEKRCSCAGADPSVGSMRAIESILPVEGCCSSLCRSIAGIYLSRTPPGTTTRLLRNTLYRQARDAYQVLRV